MAKSWMTLCWLCIALFVASPLFGSGPYTVGSANTVTADPLVPHPNTTPCVVQLFSNAAFYNFNIENFTYAPPANCPGPWAKVVLSADINVTPGIQYDRTAKFWLGPYNIFFGTTAEPGQSNGPSWHIESDLTESSAIFATAQTGVADIGNTLCCGLTSTIYASAQLEFYPLAAGQNAPQVADAVLPLSGGPSGGTVTLNTSTDTLAGTFTFPTNVVKAYLDIYSQSQSGDEFWYTCVPSDVAGELFSCGNTGFRETEVTIDGQPAGVAPVSPWIFTGGIDPYLWFPLPGVQALNFIPMRVDLTPFAGLLSNGQQHTVSLSVFNANGYFEDTATLLLYTDHGAAQVTGGVMRNTLGAAPVPVVAENLVVGNTITGSVKVSSNRQYTISGYVNTSAGRVTTRVNRTIGFVNAQYFNITSTKYVQDIHLTTKVASRTTLWRGTAGPVEHDEDLQFPLTLNISQITQANGNINQTTSSHQTFVDSVRGGRPGNTFFSLTSNDAQQTDTLVFDSSFNLLGNQNQSSSQVYVYGDSVGRTYYCGLSAANNALTGYSPTCAK